MPVERGTIFGWCLFFAEKGKLQQKNSGGGWELVEEMHNAGCTGIRLGMENGSRDHSQVVQMVKEAGLNILNSGIDELSPKWYS